MSNKNTTIMPSTPKRTSIFAPFLNALRGLDAADPPVRPAPAHATMNEGTPPTEVGRGPGISGSSGRQ